MGFFSCLDRRSQAFELNTFWTSELHEVIAGKNNLQCHCHTKWEWEAVQVPRSFKLFLLLKNVGIKRKAQRRLKRPSGQQQGHFRHSVCSPFAQGISWSVTSSSCCNPALKGRFCREDTLFPTHSTKHTDYLHPRPVKTPQTSSICAAVWARAPAIENWRESKCKGLADRKSVV